MGSPVYFWPCRSWIDREPFGVVLVIAPWNYPIQLSLSPIIAAIAAGNTVVLKPSELASASERVLCEIIEEVFDQGGAEVVTGVAEVGEALREEKFDFIFLDPPFDKIDYKILLKKIYQSNRINDNGKIFLETSKHTDLELSNAQDILKDKTIGDVRLTILQ